MAKIPGKRRRPQVILLAGPNGAGKSTAAPALLKGAFAVREFVNADEVARGLSGFDPETVSLAAGRIMLGRLHDLARHRASFGFETTLASRSFAPWLSGLRRNGYVFHLIFLWLSSPDLALARVKERVRMGGHDVSEVIVRRRYKAGMVNFFSLYRPLADRWRIYDNSEPRGPRLIAAGRLDRIERISEPRVWARLVRSAGHEG